MLISLSCGCTSTNIHSSTRLIVKKASYYQPGKTVIICDKILIEGIKCLFAKASEAPFQPDLASTIIFRFETFSGKHDEFHMCYYPNDPSNIIRVWHKNGMIEVSKDDFLRWCHKAKINLAKVIPREIR